MSDYRYQITEHQGIPCLHVITEIEENTDEPQNAFAHAYIPIGDIEASIAKWHKGTYGEEDDLYSPKLQEKLKRLGWGGWVPTPGVTDEDKFIYITLGNQHTRIMSHKEALALNDTELQRRIEEAIGMTFEQACEQYGLAPDEITSKGGESYQ